MVLDGPATAPPLRSLWELAESWWADPVAVAVVACDVYPPRLRCSTPNCWP